MNSTCTDHFHYHATKKKFGNCPVEEAKKMKCYKRLTYKQFVSVSGLCGPQFLSYLLISRTFVELCMETSYWCTILVHQYGHRKSLENYVVAYVCINISSNTWNDYTTENQEGRLFFNETAFLFWCHALWKLGSSNCCIFEMKNATGMETGTKTYFLFIFNLV